MSAFLRAIDNIEYINISPKVKDVFISSMQKMHEYFKKNNLLDVLDLDKFFERHLYKKDYLKNKKLKIKFKKQNLFKRFTDTQGYFEFHKNQITIFELSSDYVEMLKTPEKLNEEYQATFVHEFLHFITLYEDAFIKNENADQKLEKNSDFLIKEEIFEPLTEILANKIMERDGGFSYKNATDFFNILNDVFNIKSDEFFLKRSYKPYENAIGSSSFKQSQEILKKLIYDNSAIYEYPNTIIWMSTFFDSLLSDYYNLVKNNLTPKDFLNLQAKYYHNLPENNSPALSEIYDVWIRKGNLLYIEHLLKQNNLKINQYNVNKLQNLFIKSIGLSEAKMYAEKSQADFGVRVKIYGSVIVLLAKNDKLSIMSASSYKYISDKNLIQLNQNSSFIDTEFDLDYFDIPFNKGSNMRLQKEKGKNTFSIEFNTNNLNRKGEIVKNQFFKYEYQKIYVTFKNNQIFIDNGKRKATFSSENTNSFLNNFNEIINKEIKSLIKIEKMQAKVKERAVSILNKSQDKDSKEKQKE